MSTHQYPVTLHAETIASFQQDGFVKTADAFSLQELGQYARAVDAEVAIRTAADNRPVSEKNTYEILRSKKNTGCFFFDHQKWVFFSTTL